jgi:hypothetical protein
MEVVRKHRTFGTMFPNNSIIIKTAPFRGNFVAHGVSARFATRTPLHGRGEFQSHRPLVGPQGFAWFIVPPIFCGLVARAILFVTGLFG